MRSRIRVSRGVAIALALAASIALGSPARAAPPPAEGRWLFTSEIADSEREGTLTIAAIATTSRFDVRAYEQARPSGEGIAWTASATLAGTVLTIHRPLPARTAGVTGTLDGVEA